LYQLSPACNAGILIDKTIARGSAWKIGIAGGSNFLPRITGWIRHTGCIEGKRESYDAGT